MVLSQNLTSKFSITIYITRNNHISNLYDIKTLIIISRFVINFVCDGKESGDIAFHFNVRKSDRQVFRNSCQNGVWGQEERETPFFPFDSGHASEIVFFVNNDKFMVRI